jgi:hypothetical protein
LPGLGSAEISTVTGPLSQLSKCADDQSLIRKKNCGVDRFGRLRHGQPRGDGGQGSRLGRGSQASNRVNFNNLTPLVPPNPPLTDIVRVTINDPTHPWFNGATNTPFTIFAAGADPNSGGHSTPINGFFGGWNNGVPFDIARSAADYGVAVEFNPLNSGTQLNSTPNDQSALIWFTTNATHFQPTNVSFSDNGRVGTAEAYAPSLRGIPRPEPSTLVLAMIGCCAGWFAIRRGRII